MTDIFDIRGQVVVVTGGLGLLGQVFCRALRDRGARVAIFDRQAAPAETDQLVLEVDVTSRDSIALGLREVEATWGAPYALVNAAAIDAPPNAPAAENGPFETYPVESFERIMDVNVKGVALCCQVIGGRMAELGRGSIINISSIYGMVSPDQGIYEYRREQGEAFFKPIAYSVSKSALFNLTRYLATYWAPRGVRVNTLTLAGVYNNQDPRFVEAYTAKVPLGRMAEAHEYVGAIVFLMSNGSSYMTGANLVLDGGWTAW
jgi:NAD(P)-dependent dehydrogenase (short-subunit alcohol dehydrogenase family)